MKKVLIIAWSFPPAGGVGAIRPAKFVKFLPNFGWKPIVVTVKEKFYHRIDKSLIEDVHPSINIYRLPILKTKIINNEGIRWLPYLFGKIKKIIKEEKPCATYLTGGPFYPLILGPIIKKLFGLPYVVDLRDPWRLEKIIKPTKGIKTKIENFLTNILEPYIFRNADSVIFTTEFHTKKYALVYKKIAKKFITITNGYDSGDFQNINPIKFSNFTIVYTGKFEDFQKEKSPYKLLFEAIKILSSKKIVVNFVHVGEVESKIVKMTNAIGIKKLVTFVGPKPYKDTLPYQKGADLLLVTGSEYRNGIPAKLFDYIASQNTILALASPNEPFFEIIAKMPYAKIINPKNPFKIANAIEKLKQGNANVNKKFKLPKEYERRYLTEKLAQILNEIIKK